MTPEEQDAEKKACAEAAALLVEDGMPTQFDLNEIRTKAAEAARTLHERLA